MDLRNDMRKKSFLPNIFGMKEKKASEGYESSRDGSADFGDIPTCSEPASSFMKTISGLGSNSSLARLNSETRTQEFRVFVATWNVGGKPPHNGLNLNDFLPADDRSDIYVLGFQEIVPLNAGNVLVAEDSEPAIEWLHLIDRALNRPMVMETCGNQETLPSDCINSSPHGSKSVTGLFFQKASLKAASGTLRTMPTRRLKACNCPSEGTRKFYRESCFRCSQAYVGKGDTSDDEEDEEPSISMMESDKQNVVYSTPNRLRYSLVACKQMVGIFVTVWAKREHVQHIGHMRLSRIGRGILGCLGNKGCISVSMTLHQTSFCFICSHLASGEKEGDELRRNSDVIEILRNTQFSKICKTSNRRIPERIVGHDRVIWLGDLNYRIALSYTETRKLLDDNDWDMLLNKDQLKIEREAGRVFKGWNEGNIYFPPTYKYSSNSNAYAGDSLTSKKKMKKGRRTPAWCDRILWHGDGIVQMSYIRGESKFSDHRPVCAVFTVEVGVFDGRFKSSLSGPNMKVGVEELLPPNK